MKNTLTQKTKKTMLSTSKIATAQALHRLLPRINRRAFVEILQQRQEICSGERYWFEKSYQTPWDQRPDEAKTSAKRAAFKLIYSAVKDFRVAPSDVKDAAKQDHKLASMRL
jgi:hypothetical protein